MTGHPLSIINCLQQFWHFIMAIFTKPYSSCEEKLGKAYKALFGSVRKKDQRSWFVVYLVQYQFSVFCKKSHSYIKLILCSCLRLSGNETHKLSSRTRFIPVNVIVNVQPHCNGHFCWRCELASPATEVQCYWDDLRSRFLVRELSFGV